ncbi:hypothetical protein BH23CHL8_BH23CHL8_30140 [soil metagenome]
MEPPAGHAAGAVDTEVVEGPFTFRQEAETTRRILEALSVVPDLRARLDRASRAHRSLGSTAVLDAKSRLAPDLVSMVSTLLTVSVDHLGAWQSLISHGYQPNIAHLTLLRSAMETAVTGRWLMDPTIGREGRIARTAGLLLADYGHRERFETAFGIPPPKPPAKLAAARIADLRQLLAAEGVRPTDVPKPTALFDRFCIPSGPRGSAVYNMLSGFAHGRQWVALLQEVRRVADKLGGGAMSVVTSRDDVTVVVTGVAVRVVTVAVAEYETYIGV